MSFSFSLNDVPAAEGRDRAIQIASAGLWHWRPGLEVEAPEFVKGVIGAMNDPKEQRRFIRDSPCGLNDPRWVEVLLVTCTLAIYSCANFAPDSEISYVFPFRKLDSYACRLKHPMGEFVASADDPIWKQLPMPMGWMCACATLSLMTSEVPNPDVGRLPAAKRLGVKTIADASRWLETSPEIAFRYLR